MINTHTEKEFLIKDPKTLSRNPKLRKASSVVLVSNGFTDGVMFDWTLINGPDRERCQFYMWKSNIEMERPESSNSVQEVAYSFF